jgi:osmoprotectant transport system ATP-binding protein
LITLEQVSKSFGDGRFAVRALDLTVSRRSILVLLGESGCGKTTTLKLINRLVEPTAGRITVDGVDVSENSPVALRRRMGYVFQGIGLFPHRTVAENVATVPRLLGWPDSASRIEELLELVGLAPAEFLQRYPHELSGGQQQRVGVARALAARPEVLLMDEPFGAVDPITRDELQLQIKRLQRELDLTVVLVTHDVTEALLLADQIAVMRGGGIVGRGTPAELLSGSTDEYVARLMAVPRRQADAVERIAEMRRD